MSGPHIERRPFGTTHDGRDVDAIVLTNAAGASATVLTYGGILADLRMPDRDGQLGSVVLGFDELRPYEFVSPYFGATIGRVGNRIAKGTFKLGHTEYRLAINNGPNHLHGGHLGYDKRVWEAETVMADGPTVRLRLVDPDGSEGYPGTVQVAVTYTLGADHSLKIQYFAASDRPTPINLTNHSYFNLRDGGATDVLDHVLQVEADAYVPVDDTQIPTGEIAPVEGTPIDFRCPKPIGRDLALMQGNPIGYDHTLVLRGQSGDLALGARVEEPVSGRRMEMWTTEPGVQLYAGLFLDGSIHGRGGARYGKCHGFCLETQHYPDSVNRPGFPSCILRPGEVYRQITEYRFGA